MAEIRRMRPWLGTFVEIRAAGPDEGALADAIEAAFAAVERVHALMSFHDSASDVSRLNRDAAARAVAVDPWTWVVLATARDLAARSSGLFDITVAPRLVADGFLPAVSGTPPADARASWRDIDLRADGTVRFGRALQIDLGGIAKGFAVDQAVAALQAGGATCGIVNAGGDLRVFGEVEQVVYVRDPAAPHQAGTTLRVREAALATSAPYFALRRARGRRVSPLVDPRSGRSCTRQVSVSVQAPTCLLADALTKVVLADPVSAAPLLRELGAQACVLAASLPPRRRARQDHRDLQACG